MQQAIPRTHLPSTVALQCLALFVSLSLSGPAFGASMVTDRAVAGAFPLVGGRGAATLWFDPADHAVVRVASQDLASDVERVTGVRPPLVEGTEVLAGPLVLVGTLGRSSLVDGLVKAGKLDVSGVAGKWETFAIATVRHPFPRVAQALVIVGSDRRGTAFGVYELLQQIGVSPWNWWADVTPPVRRALFVRAGTRVLGPPSVKYRGLFINDEDWGLQPWAAKTFDPNTADIGPKTYRKVFELLLRLKANTLWPAMHHCTKPFNAFAENAPLADEYAIVMGSSHAEPMLRNNVGEWTREPGDYNYATNAEGVRAYWEERLRANGRFENLYTLGMRGIHDSAMVGATSIADRVALLERVIQDQRALLGRHVDPSVERVPQILCAYKEVLDVYRAGLRVPDDVTIVWPDDNFGYVRAFPSTKERERAGGSGVYYHASYLGRPLSYLWLCTTPPSLILEEMGKAYDHGADRVWILNVGDIKPAEIATDFFFQMAWDIERWRPDNVGSYLREWASRQFGDEHAKATAAILAEYYRLNTVRKPEHLQWWLPSEPQRPSPLTPAEITERLEDFARLRAAADALQSSVPATKRDGFFELVRYPVGGAALANERFFAREEHDRLRAKDPVAARAWGERARTATAALEAETRFYNEGLQGGKWRHLMTLEPADEQWRAMRIAPFVAPQDGSPLTPPPSPASVAPSPVTPTENVPAPPRLLIEAEEYSGSEAAGKATWTLIPGLGRGGGSVAVYPTTTTSVEEPDLRSRAPRLTYEMEFSRGGDAELTIQLLPTHPLVAGRGLRLALGLDQQAPSLVQASIVDGSRDWAAGVLDSMVSATMLLRVPGPGRHSLRLYMVDAGVVVDRLSLACGDLGPQRVGRLTTPICR